MRITVIEDCSPYYIRITHDGIDDIINICKKIIDRNEKFFEYHSDNKRVINLRLSDEETQLISEISPFKLSGATTCFMGILTTNPNNYFLAHKDGICNRFGINYYLEVNDDKCTTNWYDESIANGYEIINDSPFTRELKGFNPDNHVPVKTATFKQGDCILVNVDLYHDFDNRQSNNIRRILSIRPRNEGNVYYADAKSSLLRA